MNDMPKAHENIDNLITLSTLNNINPDYTGASAQKYIDKYTNKPEDAGELSAVQGMLGDMGMTPVAGEPADFLNALLYGAQGKGKEAGFSLLSILPFLGGAIKPLRKYQFPRGEMPPSKGSTLSKTDDFSLDKATGTPHAEEYYQGVPAKSGGEGYFKSLLDDLFESFKGKEF